MNVIIAIPEGRNNIVAISGALTILEAAHQNGRPFFKIKVGRMGKEDDVVGGRFKLQVDCALKRIRQADLILIPSILGDCESVLSENQKLVEWVAKMHHQKKTQIASLCTGAYLLAAGGLLDGKTASSHWDSISQLRQLFPKVKWVPEKIITDEGGVYTSGGAISSFNLILYIIEKYVGKETAHYLSKLFEINYPIPSQAPFMIFNNQKSHGDEVILEIQEYMEANLAEELKVEQLALQANMSKRNFIRRFKIATQVNPGKYTKQLRMEKAKRILETSDSSVTEAMLSVGYNDINSFRNAFVKHAGYLPLEYKKVFRR